MQWYIALPVFQVSAGHLLLAKNGCFFLGQRIKVCMYEKKMFKIVFTFKSATIYISKQVHARVSLR